MRLTQKHKWRRTIEWLRLQFPARFPVYTRKSAIKICGDCSYSNDKFFIRINQNHSFRTQLDTLFHEWAHALSWFGPPGVDDHDGEWGLAFARIYSAFTRWNYGKGEK